MIIWAFACVFAIVGVDYYYAAAFQGMGYVVQKSFVEPWKAVSLAEFWGRRWYFFFFFFFFFFNFIS